MVTRVFCFFFIDILKMQIFKIYPVVCLNSAVTDAVAVVVVEALAAVVA
jgi:hypothetical protein